MHGRQASSSTDADLPYRTSHACVGAMYRLLTDFEPRRTLAVVDEAAVESMSAALSVEALLSPGVGFLEKLRGRPSCSFERVILHRTLDGPPPEPMSMGIAEYRRAVLAEAVRVVVPGGAVAGSVANRLSIQERRAGRRHGLGPDSCAKLVTASGLRDVEVHIALPSTESPRILVDASRSQARAYFIEQAAMGRDGSQVTGWLRRLAAAAGLDRHVRGTLVFCGWKSC